MTHPPEQFYKLGQWYAITICPMDKYQFFHSQSRYIKFHNFWYEQLLSLSNYELFIEISESRNQIKQGTSGPRLHLHGKIQFKSKKHLQNFLLYKLHALLKLSMLEITKLNDSTSWYIYCKKQTLFPNNRLSSWSVANV